MYTITFKVQELSILSTQCIYVSCISEQTLVIPLHYLNWLVFMYNRNRGCFLHCKPTKRMFKCNSILVCELLMETYLLSCVLCSSVCIVTGYGLDGPEIESRWGEIFRTCPDRSWGPPSLLYSEYRVFPGGKERPGRDADPSPSLLVPLVMKE